MYNEFYGKLGELLKKIRNNNGYTLKEVATKVGKTKTWLADIESGRSRIYIEELVMLCELYNYDLNEIQRKFM